MEQNRNISWEDFEPAQESEKIIDRNLGPATTFFKDGVKRLLKNKVATVSFITIVVITLVSIILPMIWPYGYEEQLGNRPLKLPDASYNNLAPFEYGATEQAKRAEGEFVFPHIFGTDQHGRDYFIRVVYGARISLAVGFFASIIVLLIGMTLGAISGYVGGKLDVLIMRTVDIIYSLPDMLMVILLASVLKTVLGPLIQGTVLEELGANIISLFLIFALV